MSAPRVLIVDDNDALRENLTECLEDEGYTVVVARDGLEALAVLEGGPPLPDVALLDLVMPGIDGRELVKRVRADARWANVRLVLTSGLSTPDDLAAIGVDAFLPKPFGLGKLLDTIRTFAAR